MASGIGSLFVGSGSGGGVSSSGGSGVGSRKRRRWDEKGSRWESGSNFPRYRYSPQHYRLGRSDHRINLPGNFPSSSVLDIDGQLRGEIEEVIQIPTGVYNILDVGTFHGRLDRLLANTRPMHRISVVYLNMWRYGVLRPSELGRQLLVGLLKGYAAYFEKHGSHGRLNELQFYYFNIAEPERDDFGIGKFHFYIMPPPVEVGRRVPANKDWDDIVNVLFGTVVPRIDHTVPPLIVYQGDPVCRYERDMMLLYNSLTTRNRSSLLLYQLSDDLALWSWIRRTNYVMHFHLYKLQSPFVVLTEPKVCLLDHLAHHRFIDPFYSRVDPDAVDWIDVVRHPDCSPMLRRVFDHPSTDYTPVGGRGLDFICNAFRHHRADDRPLDTSIYHYQKLEFELSRHFPTYLAVVKDLVEDLGLPSN